MDLKRYWDGVEELLRQNGMDPVRQSDEEGRPYLSVPVTLEGNRLVFTQLCLSGDSEDTHFLQIYTTIRAEVAADPDRVGAALARMALQVPMGALGLYAEERQVFHKYLLPLSKALPVEEALRLTGEILGLEWGVAGEYYERIQSVCD